MPESADCWYRAQQTLELVSNKWAIPLILTLYAHPALRYNQLAKALHGISAKELARQLRHLESGGIVQRTVFPSKPPAVEYALTPLGQTLPPILAQLASWSTEHGQEVQASGIAPTPAPAAGRIHRIR
jgi:DNA-binding HxlR family transcriptional regulator